VNGTKLNNEKNTNSFSNDDYVMMTSFLPSTETYEKMEMRKNAPPIIEEKHNTPTTQDQVTKSYVFIYR